MKYQCPRWQFSRISQLILDHIKRLFTLKFQMRQQFANKSLELLGLAELAQIIDQKSAKGWFGINTGNGWASVFKTYSTTATITSIISSHVERFSRVTHHPKGSRSHPQKGGRDISVFQPKTQDKCIRKRICEKVCTSQKVSILSSFFVFTSSTFRILEYPPSSKRQYFSIDWKIFQPICLYRESPVRR